MTWTPWRIERQTHWGYQNEMLNRGRFAARHTLAACDEWWRAIRERQRYPSCKRNGKWDHRMRMWRRRRKKKEEVKTKGLWLGEMVRSFNGWLWWRPRFCLQTVSFLILFLFISFKKAFIIYLHRAIKVYTTWNWKLDVEGKIEFVCLFFSSFARVFRGFFEKVVTGSSCLWCPN